jgi:uncharacterized membrane protein
MAELQKPGEPHPEHGNQRAVTTGTRLFKARLWFASALWVPVLGGNILVIILAFLLPEVDRGLGQESTIPLSQSTTQAIFAAVAGSMITFTGIVFSAIFIAAQIQTSSYSPRLAAQLRQDPIIMGALVLSTATAAYALFALAAVDRLTTSVGAEHGVPALTVMFGLFLAVATLAWFAALVQRAFENIQIGGILRSLSKRAWRVIDDVHPSPSSNLSLPRPQTPDTAVAEIQHFGDPGVLAAVDRRALLKIAHTTGGFVEVVPQVGEYLTARSGVLRLYDAHTEPTPKQVRRVFVLARQRTTDQDPAFAMRILVDIAVRAVSSAINDPTTAVQVIDRIEALLIHLYERHPGSSYVVDAAGEPRGLVHAPDWEEYFELGSTEIRIYGGQALQIHRRMRAMHEHLLELVQGSDRERVVLELQLLDESMRSTLTQPHDLALARESDRLGLGSV